MEYCKVAVTEKAPRLDNKTIISIEKNGYIDNQQNLVLRKAEVITLIMT